MSDHGVIHHGHWRDTLAALEGDVDALICDPPYGERTYAGVGAERRDDSAETALTYTHWAPGDVHEFVRAWAPRVRGWIVALTSHALIPTWTAAYEEAGRYAFAPVPCVIRGMTVRMTGDGPSSWAVYAMVARRRDPGRCGALPGAYVVTRGRRATNAIVGGKPIGLMSEIIRDYSSPGDLVCDPVCGAGTTLVAAHRADRRWVGGEMDAGRCEIARANMARETAQLRLV